MRLYMFFVILGCFVLPVPGEAKSGINYFKDSGEFGKCYEIVKKKSPIGNIEPPVDIKHVVLRKGAGEYKSQRASGSWNKLHTGIDLIVTNYARRNNRAIPVRAIAKGKIVYNALNTNRNKDISEGFGYTRIIDHGNGCYSLYAHLTDDNNYTRCDDDGAVGLSDKKSEERCDKNRKIEPLMNKEVEAGEVIGHIIEPINKFGVDEVSTGNARSHINDTARYQLHFSLISSTGEGVPAWKIKSKYFYDTSTNKQYGYWVDPTGIFKFKKGKAKPDCHRLHCPGSKDEAMRHLFDRLGLGKKIVNRSIASLSSVEKNVKLAKKEVILSAAASSTVYGGVYESLVGSMPDNERSKVKKELNKELKVLLDSDVVTPDGEVLSKVNELVTGYELGIKKSNIKKLSAFITKEMALGGNKDEIIYSTAIEYGMKHVLANSDASEYVSKITKIQEETARIINSANRVSDDISSASSSIKSIVSGQTGMIDGINSVMTSANSIVNSMDAVGIKIGDDGKKALKAMNDIGSIVNAGAAFFAGGGIANPMAVVGAASDVLGIFTGGQSAKTDPWLKGQLDAINGKLGKIQRGLDLVDKKIDNVLENQAEINAKLDRLEKKIDRFEKNMMTGFQDMSMRFDELERQISEQNRTKLNGCVDIDKAMNRYLTTNNYTFDVYKSPRYLEIVKQYSEANEHLYKNAACAGMGILPLAGCGKKPITRMIVESCLHGFIDNFSASCGIQGWLRDKRLISEIKKDHHPLEDAYEMFAEFIGSDVDAWYLPKGNGTSSDVPILASDIAKYMYAFSIPSSDMEHLLEKKNFIDLRESKNDFFSTKCTSMDDGGGIDKSSREVLMSPVNDEDLIETGYAALRELPVLANHPYARGERANIFNRTESIMYAIEIAMIQKTLMSGDIYLPLLVNRIRNHSEKSDKKEMHSVYNILSNTKSRSLLSNIGLYLLYSSQDYPYGGYELAYKACLKDKSFCYKLLDLLEIPCKKDSIGYCESYEYYSVKLGKSEDKKDVVFLNMSYGDKSIDIPLPEPDMDNSILKNNRFVYSVSLTKLLDLYLALNNFRYYLVKNDKG